MSKNAATEQQLGELHSKVASVMTRAIIQIEHAQTLYDDIPDAEKQEKGLLYPPTLSAPLMGVMTKFLADNSITCAPEQGAEMTGLERALHEKREKRLKRAGAAGNVVDLFEET